jgi:phosphoglycerate-specific signal transduction histidine kinase
MTDEQIIEIAHKCLDAPNVIRDEWKADEEQLLKFAQQIFEMGRESASPDGVY